MSPVVTTGCRLAALGLPLLAASCGLGSSWERAPSGAQPGAALDWRADDTSQQTQADLDLLGVPITTPQRPSVSSSTATTLTGSFEVELGATVDPHDTLGTPIALKYGLDDRTELFAAQSPYNVKQRSGTNRRGSGDLQLGARQRFAVNPAQGDSLAWQAIVQLPTGSKTNGFSSDETDLFGAIIADFGEPDTTWTLFYQLGLLGEDHSSGIDVQHAFAMAASTALAERWGASGELAWITTPERHDSPLLGTLGMNWSSSPTTTWDAGIIKGLNDDAPSAQFVLGVTYNFGRRDPR